MGEIEGFAKEDYRKPVIPETIQNAIDLQEKVKKKVDSLISNYQKSYTSLNYLEQMVGRNEPIEITIVDQQTFQRALSIPIPAKDAKKYLESERKRLAEECEDYEHKLRELFCVMEEMFDE
jgi:flagellar biosynthesis chaperone FliJ